MFFDDRYDPGSLYGPRRYVYGNDDGGDAIKFFERKIVDSFQNPLRGLSTLVWLLLLWSLWPSATYRQGLFVKHDIRTKADVVNEQAALREVTQIRKQIITLGAENNYGPDLAYEQRKRMEWLSHRVKDPEFHNAAVSAYRDMQDMLSAHKNPVGVNIGQGYLDHFRNRMLDQEFKDVRDWQPVVSEFQGFKVLAWALWNYWMSVFGVTFPLAVLYNLLVMIDRKLWLQYELTVGLLFFVLASAFPQIGVWVYPTKQRSKEVAGMMKFAVCAFCFIFAVCCANLARAQSSQEENRREIRQEAVIDASHTAVELPKRYDSLLVWLFGDVTGKNGHDRQIIAENIHASGATEVVQVRQTADSKIASATLTIGWTFRPSKQFSLTATAGPAFNLDNPSNDRGFNHQIPAFVIGVWSTKFGRFTNVNKLIFTTKPAAVPFSDRHIFTARGPTVGTPRMLQGIALDIEAWHANGPYGGHWNEFQVGPSLNPAEMVGKAKSKWARVSVYVYRDFCRPQPAHPTTWDVRVQYQLTHQFAR